MVMYDVIGYIAFAAILVYCAYLIIKHVRRKKRRKPEPPVGEKFIALCQTTSQQFRLNLMAIEAARQMAASAVRSSKTSSKTHNPT